MLQAGSNSAIIPFSFLQINICAKLLLTVIHRRVGDSTTKNFTLTAEHL